MDYCGMTTSTTNNTINLTNKTVVLCEFATNKNFILLSLTVCRDDLLVQFPEISGIHEYIEGNLKHLLDGFFQYIMYLRSSRLISIPVDACSMCSFCILVSISANTIAYECEIIQIDPTLQTIILSPMSVFNMLWRNQARKYMHNI
eukprot:245271_1